MFLVRMRCSNDGTLHHLEELCAVLREFYLGRGQIIFRNLFSPLCFGSLEHGDNFLHARIIHELGVLEGRLLEAVSQKDVG